MRGQLAGQQLEGWARRPPWGSAPNSSAVAASTGPATSGPCTMAVTARGQAPAGPRRRSGAARWSATDRRRSRRRARSVSRSSIVSTSASSTCMKYWKSWYGRRQRRDRATARPRRSCRTSGRRCAAGAARSARGPCRPVRRRIRSMPAVMLPHWSDPATWSSQPSVSLRTQIVVGLQQHVGELGEGDAVLPLDAGPDRVLGQHPC